MLATICDYSYQQIVIDKQWDNNEKFVFLLPVYQAITGTWSAKMAGKVGEWLVNVCMFACFSSAAEEIFPAGNPQIVKMLGISRDAPTDRVT